MNSSEKPQLSRQLGAGDLAMNAINLTVGSGIFILPAYVAGYLGAMSFLAYIFCSILMGLIMLCFAEMGSIPSAAGGAYDMIDRAFGPFVGFLGNTLFWFGFAVLSDAAILNAMADMLSIWFPIYEQYWFRVIFFLVVIGLFTVINIRGVKSGSRVIIALTALKLMPLVLLILVGLFEIDADNLQLPPMPDMTTFGAACLLLFFAFGGSETALNISGEIKNPGKTIPRGIFMGIGAILVIYLLLQFVATGVLGNELANFTDAPLAETARRLVGPVGGTILIATAAVSMFSLVGGDILATSRLPFIAAQNGLLPRLLSEIHPRYKSPHLAIIFYSCVIFIMSISGGFKTLAILSSSSVLLIYLGVVLAMFKCRLKPDSSHRPEFRVPGGLTIPILSLAVLVWLISYVPLKEFLALALFFVIATVFYWCFKQWKSRSGVSP